MLRAHGRRASRACRAGSSSPAAMRGWRLTVAPRHRRPDADAAAASLLLPRRSCSARARARSGAGASARPDPAAILRDLQDLESRRPGGARGIRRRPLRRPAADGDRRPARRVPGARIPATATASTCRCTRCTWSAATPAARPRTRRCTSSAPTSGRGRAGAPPSRCATSPPSCSTCTRAARRSRPRRCRSTSSNTRPSPTPFRSRKPPIRPRPSARCSRTCKRPGRWTASSAATSASARPRWRCAPPSSPCRPARQVAVLVPDHAAGAAAPAEFPRPLRRLAGAHRGAVALPHRARRRQAVLEGLEQRHGRHRHRHPPAAARARALPAISGLIIVDEEHRFGVRDKERLQGAARRSARADADRHADPAHAQHGARRAARPVADHDAARRRAWRSRPSSSSGTRRRCARRCCASCAAAARCTSCTTRCRRIEKIAAELRALVPEAERAHRPRADARARARAADGRLLPSALQPAGVHHHHRERHRRADGQHHHDQPRRPLRAGAAAPAARPRRPLAPPRLCLPDRAVAQGADRAMPPSAWRRSSRWRSSAPASCSPPTIWRSAAPASCSASSRAAQLSEVGLSHVPGHARAGGPGAARPGASRRSTGRWRRPPRWSCSVPAFLPEDYVADVHVRLALYKRIAAADAMRRWRR